MSNGFSLDAFEQDLKETLEEGRRAFKGDYKEALDELTGLSRDEVNAITPDITDLQKYDELITVVKKASAVNLQQADLKAQIVKLGGVAVEIAKKVPSLAALFV